MGGANVAVLLAGLAIVLVEGALIARQGWEFLQRVYPDPRQATLVAALILGQAFLLMSGVLLLAATVGLDQDAGISAVLARVGVLFLLTAGMHLLVIVVLSREKAEVADIELTEDQIDTAERGTGGGSAALPPSPRARGGRSGLPFLP
jgi:hypothetical protein